MSNPPGAGSYEVMTEQQKEESDQLPEEGPEQQVVDDDGRDEADENAGVPGEGGQHTGNPDNAG